MVSAIMIFAVVIGIGFVAGIGLGFIPIDFQTGTIGGVPQPQPPAVVRTGDFSGELDVIIQHFDTLDNSFNYQEGIARDIVTVFYKSSDGIQFSSIGEGVQGIGGASRVTITPDMNNILYATVGVAPTPTEIYSDPVNTQLANDRIVSFTFQDVTFDGIKEWLYRIDLHGVVPPIAGQDASTISFITKSYNVGFPITINAPVNIVNVGSDAGTVTYVRWELTVPQGTATPQTEYQIGIGYAGGGQGGTELWDVGQSSLEIPNIGVIALSAFEETPIGTTNATYKFKIQRPDGTTGFGFDSANYVVTPQNGNEVTPMPFKIVTSLQDNAVNDNLDVTLTIKSLDKTGSSNTPITDTIRLDES